MDWILCLIAGALAGFVVSMTGSGAGFLLVPGLSLALSFSAFPSADLFKIAVATTHGANLITNLAAFQAHAVRRSIDWEAFIRLGPGSIAGAAAGASQPGSVNVLTVLTTSGKSRSVVSKASCCQRPARHQLRHFRRFGPRRLSGMLKAKAATKRQAAAE